MQPSASFSLSYDGLISEIIHEIGISVPLNYQPIHSNDPNITKVNALWDTGATGSCITSKIATMLKLQPITKINVFHAGGMTLSNVYLVNLYLPNTLVVTNVRVTETASLSGKFDVLIGMNIITLGDFSITNVNKKTVFSFRFPSIKKIDYVEEHEFEGQLQSLGRNGKCPCGSGRKVKQCHGLIYPV